MSTLVLLDADVSIDDSGGSPVDLSDHVQSLSLTFESDLQDSSAMGNTFRQRLGGVKDWSVDITFLQDFAAAKVDVTMFALVGVSGTFTGKPTPAAVSPTNPEFTGEFILGSYPIFSNSHGEIALSAVHFDGNGTLSRITS